MGIMGSVLRALQRENGASSSRTHVQAIQRERSRQRTLDDAGSCSGGMGFRAWIFSASWFSAPADQNANTAVVRPVASVYLCKELLISTATAVTCSGDMPQKDGALQALCAVPWTSHMSPAGRRTGGFSLDGVPRVALAVGEHVDQDVQALALHEGRVQVRDGRHVRQRAGAALHHRPVAAVHRVHDLRQDLPRQKRYRP